MQVSLPPHLHCHRVICASSNAYALFTFPVPPVNRLIMLKQLNPLKIIAIWLCGVIVINLIAIPVLFKKTSGGEQAPITFLMNSIDIAGYGIFVICCFSAILFQAWAKSHWYYLIPLTILSGLYVFFDLKEKNNTYSIQEDLNVVDGAEIVRRREFYSLKDKTIRSEKFWRNGKKDSTWTVYSPEGEVVERESYKDGKVFKDR